VTSGFYSVFTNPTSMLSLTPSLPFIRFLVLASGAPKGKMIFFLPTRRIELSCTPHVESAPLCVPPPSSLRTAPTFTGRKANPSFHGRFKNFAWPALCPTLRTFSLFFHPIGVWRPQPLARFSPPPPSSTSDHYGYWSDSPPKCASTVLAISTFSHCYPLQYSFLQAAFDPSFPYKRAVLP